MVRAIQEQASNTAISTAAAGLSFDERLTLLVQREVVWRDDRRVQQLLIVAKLKVSSACIEDINLKLKFPRGREHSVVQAERNDAPRYGTPRANSVRVTGRHFSQDPPSTPVSSAYGSGLRGSSAEQFLAAADPRSRSRV